MARNGVLDVHKNSIVAAFAHPDGSEPCHYGKWGGSNLAAERGLLKLLKKFGLEKGDVRACYEAGPTGFVLGRRLLKLGYDCIIVAPTAVPKKSGKRVKTDRRDATSVKLQAHGTASTPHRGSKTFLDSRNC